MLFRAAERDITSLSFMRDSDEFPDGVFGFHVQQGTEKMLKAHLAVLGKKYPITHNLETLLELLAVYGIPSNPGRNLTQFTTYAVEFRYQGVGPDAEPVDREDTLAHVEILRGQVGRALEGAEGG